MSEKLKRCSLCEEGEFIPVCDVCGAIGTNTRAYEAELAALREENERLRSANPWRYPSRGENPNVWCGQFLVYQDCTFEVWTVYDGKWKNGSGMFVSRQPNAWRELPEPAPKLEDE